MKKFCITLSLIIISILCFIPKGTTPLLASTQEENQEEIVYLTNSPNSHYYQIGEVASFALSGDELYYTNTSHQLLSYTLSTNTPNQHDIFGVTMLRPKNNSLFFVSDGNLYSYDGKTQTTIGAATIFDYYENQTTNTLCYLNENILTIASYDQDQVLQPIKTYDFNTINNIDHKDIKAITATDKGCILLCEHERSSSIDIEFYYLLPTVDTPIHNTISDSYYNCSMIKYSKIGEQQVLALLYQNNIAVIEIDDNLNWERTDILLQSSNNTIYAPSYIHFTGNSILASDNIKKDIKSFEIQDLQDSSSMITTTLLGSSGSSVDQYQDVQSIFVKDENDVIINDAGNYRLKRITCGATETSDLFNYQSTDEVVNQIEVDYFNQTVILYYDTANHCSYLRYYKDRQLSNAVKTITLTGLVQSFMIDNKNSVYYTKEDGLYKAQEKIIDLPLTNSKLFLSRNANELILLDGQNAYTIDTTNHTYTLLSTTLSNYTSACIDYFNNIYLLDGNVISKYIITDDVLQYATSTTLKRTYATMSLNQENGKFYLYDETNACLCTYHNQTFSSGMSEYEHTNLSELHNGTTLVNLANFTTSTVWITKYPNHIGTSYPMTFEAMGDGSKISVAILDKIQDDAHIAFYNHDNTLVDGYVPLSYLREKQIALAEEKEYYVISKSANTYSIPSHDANLSTPLTKNDLVNIVSYPIHDMTAIDFDYLAVKQEDKIVYVLASDVLPVTIHASNKNTLQNATIKTKESSIHVYLTADEESPILTTLTSGTRIYAYDYDEDTTWTKIKYLNENHEEVEGYILSAYIKPDSPSTLIIICVILSIVAGVILIVVLVNVIKIKQKYSK